MTFRGIQLNRTVTFGIRFICAGAKYVAAKYVAAQYLAAKYVAALLILATLCGVARADSHMEESSEQLGDEQFQQVYQLPVWIDSVVSTCNWKTEGGSGFVRVIRTTESFGHGLYLQWVRYGIAGGEAKAVSTVVVEELWQDLSVRFEMPTAEFGKGYCQLNSMAESTSSELRYELILKVGAPGKYQLDVVRHLKSGY